MAKVLITAHTGCLGTPMNSVESVLAALTLPVDLIEVDIRFTPAARHGSICDGSLDRIEQDFEPVLSHDPLTQEAEVRLADILPLLRSPAATRLNLDLYEQHALPSLHHLLSREGFLDRVIMTNVTFQQVPNVRSQFPGSPVFVDIEAADFFQKPISEWIALGLSGEIAGFNLHFPLISQALVNACHEADLCVSAWTVDDASDMRRMIRMGVDMITTNQPDWLIRIRDEEHLN